MNLLFFVLRIFFQIKIIFKDPKECELVIFDNSSIIDLAEVIKNRKYFVLENRIDRITTIYISLNIIKLFIKNYKNKIWTAYLISLLDIIRPKVVFTFIDNSLKFSEIAKLRSNRINFVALQNGARYEHKEYAFLYKKKVLKYNYNSQFFIPHLLCFGKHEIKEFKKYNIKVSNFFTVGSLRISNFLSYKKRRTKVIFDICLISDVYAWDRVFDCYNSSLKKGIIILVKFVIRFCIQYNLKVTLALRSYITDTSNLSRELNFYKKYLTDAEYSFLSKGFFHREEKNRFGIYELMRDSKVVIGSISTTLRENLAMNGKTLACNFTPTDIFDFPIKGLCFIKNRNYKFFEKRLLKVINIKKKEYFSKINRNYVINYEKNISTAEKVNNKLDFFLKKI
jgi:surface carbohydrate biosynthesis protein